MRNCLHCWHWLGQKEAGSLNQWWGFLIRVDTDDRGGKEDMICHHIAYPNWKGLRLNRKINTALGAFGCYDDNPSVSGLSFEHTGSHFDQIALFGRITHSGIKATMRECSCTRSARKRGKGWKSAYKLSACKPTSNSSKCKLKDAGSCC